MVRPNIQANFVPSGKITIRKDYDYRMPEDPPVSAAPPTQALWDVAVWDVDTWPAVTVVPYAGWKSVNGFGSMLAPVYQITVNTTDDIDVRMTSLDLLYELGEAIG
jgi:hypothetical protein